MTIYDLRMWWYIAAYCDYICPQVSADCISVLLNASSVKYTNVVVHCCLLQLELSVSWHECRAIFLS